MSKFVDREAGEPVWKLLHRLADKAQPKIRRAFIDAIAQAKNGVVMKEVQEAIRTGGLNKAFSIAERAWDQSSQSFRAKFSESVLEMLRQAAKEEVAAAMLPVRQGIRFDFSQGDALSFIQRFTGDKVRQINQQTKLGIREAVAKTFSEGRAQGLGVQPASELIRDFIGLTRNQVQTVMDFRRSVIELMNTPDAGLPASLQQQMSRAFINREKLNAANIKKAVARYRDNLIQERALTISRTETIAAAAEAQQAVWDQALDQGIISAQDFEVGWIVTPDDRLCSRCAAMKGKRRPIDGTYPTGVGKPGLHPNCRCAERLLRKATTRKAVA